MLPWAIMEEGTLRVCSAWQEAQATWAARRSPGLTKRMKSGDSGSVAAAASCGLALLGQSSRFFGCTWAASIRVRWRGSVGEILSGTSMFGCPPWQSTQARRTEVSCIVWLSVWLWQARQDLEKAMTSASSARPVPAGAGAKLKPSILAVCVVGTVVADHIVLMGCGAVDRVDECWQEMRTTASVTQANTSTISGVRFM